MLLIIAIFSVTAVFYPHNLKELHMQSSWLERTEAALIHVCVENIRSNIYSLNGAVMATICNRISLVSCSSFVRLFLWMKNKIHISVLLQIRVA